MFKDDCYSGMEVSSFIPTEKKLTLIKNGASIYPVSLKRKKERKSHQSID